MKTHEIESLAAERAWVARLARRMLRDADAAEDVAQDTLVAALESPPPVDRPARGWLGRVATNVVRGRHRSTTRRAKREHTAVAYADTEATDTFTELLQQQAASHLAVALAELTEPFHTAIRLRFFDDLSVAEVAARQGVPVGTAGWRISEGVKRLRAALVARAGGDARPYLMALCPMIPVPSSVPLEATAPASLSGGKNMSSWIGIGVAATVIVGAGGVATVVASGAAESAAIIARTGPAQGATESERGASEAARAAVAQQVETRAAPAGGADAASAIDREGGVIMMIKRSGPGGAGEIPTALHDDVVDYSQMLFECFDAQPESTREKRATLRIAMVQEPDGAVIDSSDASSARDPDLGECLRSVGLAIKLGDAIGPVGTRYEIDMQIERAMPGNMITSGATRACLDDYARRNPGAKLDGQIGDPELTKCITRDFPGAKLTQAFPPEARAGVERCASELKTRRPDLVGGGAAVDDAAFTRCIQDVMGIDGDGAVVFVDDEAALGDMLTHTEANEVAVRVLAHVAQD